VVTGRTILPVVTNIPEAQSAANRIQQDAEKVRQLCSRIAQRLNVPKRTIRLFARCGLAVGHFEHPAVPTPSEPFDKISVAVHVYTEFFRSLIDRLVVVEG
jgi:hypothetical protein